jgi:hypothetical protein
MKICVQICIQEAVTEEEHKLCVPPVLEGSH